MGLNLSLLIILIILALWTVMTTRLVRSVIGLAMTSALLSIIMFRLNSPLAAVFELSVCSGLISVIFVTTISFTQRLTQDQLLSRQKERLGKFWYLPFIVILAGILLSMVKMSLSLTSSPGDYEQDVRNVLWNLRHLDLLGQVVLLLAGAFGVVVLFKEKNR
jgi:NADH-quinone oxidoreductase subunit J